MAHAPQQLLQQIPPEPPRSCFSPIKHSETCQQLKQAALITTTAVATIAILGGLLGVLAMNGVNLSAINNLTTMIGEKYIYIGIVSGISLLAIDSVLISALIRSYNDKQYSMQQINNMGLNQLLQNEDILSKLENGQFWPFSKDAVPASPTNPEGDPAVFGFVVRDRSGNSGVYAFKTAEDYHAQLRKLGYTNGKAAYEDSNEYTIGYLKTKVSEGKIQETKGWAAEVPSLGLDEYRKASFEENGFEYHVLQFNRTGQTEVPIFREMHDLNAARDGLIKYDHIQAKLPQDQPAYLPANSFWIDDHMPTVETYKRDGQVDEVNLYLVHVRDQEGVTCEHFTRPETAQRFVGELQDKNFRNAKAELGHPTEWPTDYILSNYDQRQLEPLRNTVLLSNSYITEDLDDNTFALKVKQSDGQESLRFFKTAEARNTAIQDPATSALSDVTRIVEEAFGPTGPFVTCLRYVLPQGQSGCWSGQDSLDNTPYVAMVVDGERKLQLFSDTQQRGQFLQQPGITDLSAQFFSYGESRQFADLERQFGVSQEQIQTLVPQLLTGQHRVFDPGEITSLRAFLLVVATDDGIKPHFFTSTEDRTAFLEAYHPNSMTPEAQQAINARADAIYSDAHIGALLQTQCDYYQVDENNICFRFFRNEEGRVAFTTSPLPDWFTNNVGAQIVKSGEYPEALGQSLYKGDENGSTLQPFQYKKLGQQDTGNSFFPVVFPVLFKDERGNTSIRYFATEKAQGDAVTTYLAEITKPTRQEYFGERFDVTGRLKVGEYAIVEHVACVILLWVKGNGKKPCIRRFLETVDEAQAYVTNHLESYTEYSE